MDVDAVISILRGLCFFLSVVADLLGIGLGCLAIWGLVAKRRELAQIFRVLTAAHFGQQSNRLKETLGQLNALDFDDKTDRAEIRALIGQICGQLSPLLANHPKLGEFHLALIAYVDGTSKITEARKRRIVHELQGYLDEIAMDHQRGDFAKR